MKTNVHRALPETYNSGVAGGERTIVLLMGHGVTAQLAGQRSELLGTKNNVQKFPAEASISKLDSGELVLAVTLPNLIEQKPDGTLHGSNQGPFDYHRLTTEEIRAEDRCDLKQVEVCLHEEISPRDEIDRASVFEEIVGSSAPLRSLLAGVTKVAPTDSTVLITGETGTGKELIARAIHKRSARAGHAFVSVNCSAIPIGLIGAALFGHEKGAFTGAVQRHIGRFELAKGGTLFLDEVGELPLEMQVALLRVLQEGEFERVGGTQPVHADVRIVAATNRDLQAAIAAGTFREDLYYRLNVFPIEMPPLRERRTDIAMLTEHFIHRHADKMGRKIARISKKTLELFQGYDWPGNIRELQNIVERSLIVCDTDTFVVDPNWLASKPTDKSAAGQPLPQRLASDQKALIEAALAESGGRVSGASGAATKLGMPSSTLESKIRALKINKHAFKA